ncbi:MAG: hypothetical protein M3Z75_28805 [Actinomycetota bacterium]|nr:hypothetical protein [Actinomycetota bacterium]
MTTLSSLARTVRRLHKEQVYAWGRFFRAGLPDPAQAREAASARRRERGAEREVTTGRPPARPAPR